MKALSKEQEQERTKLLEQLRKEDELLRAAIEEVNELIEQKVNSRVATMNGILSNMAALKDEVTEAQTDYYDERSEKWQESDAGSTYNDWKNEWDVVDLPDEVEPYEPLEETDVFTDAADEFENLPSSPD
jgi:coenzyme F420-reducing hydrogenase alpha subunit